MIDDGEPLFLQQLVETLRAEQTAPVRGLDAEPVPAPTEIGRAAAVHGAELLRRDSRIDEGAQDCGDECQCVRALEVEQDVAISTGEFRTLERCLDNAIADSAAQIIPASPSAKEVSA